MIEHDTGNSCQVTYIGGPTALIEVGSLRILTDPTFDAPGEHYWFALGVGSKKTAGPAISAEAVGNIDTVLLSHDNHSDNLDHRGRQMLSQAFQVITTPSAAKRLGDNTVGLKMWESTRVVAPDGYSVRVIATPARHGPPGAGVMVGETTGFLLEWAGQQNGVLYISGDTVYYPKLREIGARYRVGVGLLHMGGARFNITGPLRYSMRASDASRLASDLRMRTVLPIHYEDWGHFREDPSHIKTAFDLSDDPTRLRWLKRGEPVRVEV
jgi:L-ascorbate metabolism protein UlaG (beta-lactamase superfamily)